MHAGETVSLEDIFLRICIASLAITSFICFKLTLHTPTIWSDQCSHTLPVFPARHPCTNLTSKAHDAACRSSQEMAQALSKDASAGQSTADFAASLYTQVSFRQGLD